MGWDGEVVGIVRDLLRRAAEGCVDGEVDLTIFEETFGAGEPGDEEWRELLHGDLPGELRGLLDAAGARNVRLWHRKDDVNLPEYVAEVVFDGRVLAVDLIASYDEETDQTILHAVRACPGSPDPNILAYYHEV